MKVDEGEGVYYSREPVCDGRAQPSTRGQWFAREGAESVVVSRCSSKTGGRRCLVVAVHINSKAGAAALWRNLVTNGQPIRVFAPPSWRTRAPPLLNGKKEPAQYRYDGLYDIACMGRRGNRSVKQPSQAPPGSRKGKKRKAPIHAAGPRRAACGPTASRCCRRPRRPRFGASC